MNKSQQIKSYYQLTKPGIIYGNILTASAGFLLASKGHVRLLLMLATLIGTALVIASGCVYNNFIDRHIDKEMKRTKKRALVTGSISGSQAITFATLLGFIGFLILGLYTNLVTFMIGVIGLIFYVAIYGFWKRKSYLGTMVGSISGATPIVAGYCAVSGRVDLGAVLLFIILACWQLPHFYAIAIYRADEYKAAGIPVLPVVKSVKTTKIHILVSTAAFVTACILLTVFGYTGYSYLIVMSLLGTVWLYKSIQGFTAANDNVWARKMFFFSLYIILGLSVMLAIDSLII